MTSSDWHALNSETTPLRLVEDPWISGKFTLFGGGRTLAKIKVDDKTPKHVLYQLAQELHIPGRSRMNKKTLHKEVVSYLRKAKCF